MGGHSSIQTIEGEKGWWGQLGSERDLPQELEALPAFSPERAGRVGAWRRQRYEEAYAAILAVHPEVAGGKRSMGSISVTAGE